MKGLFITFEGNDGSGKSSAIQAVYNELKQQNMDVILTREPGGSKIAEKIRTIILDVDNLGMDSKTEAMLYAASRREHLVKKIIPALESGKIVLSDRYLDSSLVYQGIARGIGVKEVYELNQFAIGEYLPDLTIMITVKPEIGMERIKNNRHELDRLELEKIEFHNKVYNGYQEVASLYSNRIVMIDGEKSKEMVLAETIKIVSDFIKSRGIEWILNN